ncbi:hypothetical protein JVX98_19375 [Ensifer sp. PDNC004]|uniref:hypothetical protein n=1 Tax=Ensifer sp. PDNC004 TaxID=2811423 RepID=UPI0019645D30|nr:hypothetical protein [Ensifer sp. PDNC004]QRY66558.1 hypothetical protein JVX98_19375 [Ensifer sp. PDNC004]
MNNNESNPPASRQFDDESVLVEEWSDPARRERYQYYAREKYEFYKSAREMSFKANIDYGKWLLASGLAVHGGAIYAINSLKDPARPELMMALLLAAKWNIAGIAFVLFAGLMAWINFQSAADVYDDWANPLMVYRTDQNPQPRKTDAVGATRLLAAFAGVLALWALLASAANVFGALSPVAH